MFPAKARTGVDFWRSPINGALGYMPEYTEHAKENPIEIVIGDRLLTDEEIEREAAFLRFRNALVADDERNGLITATGGRRDRGFVGGCVGVWVYGLCVR